MNGSSYSHDEYIGQLKVDRNIPSIHLAFPAPLLRQPLPLVLAAFVGTGIAHHAYSVTFSLAHAWSYSSDGILAM